MNKLEIIAVIVKAFSENKPVILTVGETPFDSVEVELDPNSVMAASPKEETVIEKILSAPSLETAIKYTGKEISAEEEMALNQLRERLKPELLATRESRMKQAISMHLTATRSKLTVGEVFEFMCENIFGEEKPPQNLDNEQEINFTNKIDEYIEKMEEVSF